MASSDSATSPCSGPASAAQPATARVQSESIEVRKIERPRMGKAPVLTREGGLSGTGDYAACANYLTLWVSIFFLSLFTLSACRKPPPAAPGPLDVAWSGCAAVIRLDGK